MARFFTPMTSKELSNHLANVIRKTIKEDYEDNSHIKDLNEILGIHTLDNGFSFCGVYAGGDSEIKGYQEKDYH